MESQFGCHCRMLAGLMCASHMKQECVLNTRYILMHCYASEHILIELPRPISLAICGMRLQFCRCCTICIVAVDAYCPTADEAHCN